MAIIAANLQQIHNRIADACTRAHRSPAEVTLMAVSKMHPAEAILEAHAAGQRLFGENRVQEWQTKSAVVQLRRSISYAFAKLALDSASLASKSSPQSRHGSRSPI